MTNLVYNGAANFREFSAADFKQAGVEGKKVVFERGVPQEVDDSVAEVIMSNEGNFVGEHTTFSEVKDEEPKAATADDLGPVDTPEVDDDLLGNSDATVTPPSDTPPAGARTTKKSAAGRTR